MGMNIKKLIREEMDDFEWADDVHDYGDMIPIHTEDGVEYVSVEDKQQMVADDTIWFDPTDNKWHG